MCRISFVILHYNNLAETEKCLDSLKKYLAFSSVHVIVVDNGSTKESVKQITNKYKSHQIHFIISDKNLGFAKGNNLGYNYAKYKLNSDVIVLTNNDTVYKQEDFIDKLVMHYKQGFDIAGPKILTNNGKYNQNPVMSVYHSTSELKKGITKLYILYILSWFGIDLKIQKLFGKGKEIPNNNYKNKDFKLHGACLLFSGNYLKKFDGLYSGTFMYGEEDILRFRAKKYNLRFDYFDDLEVLHKGNATTDKEIGSGRKTRMFKYKWAIDSSKQLLNMMKNV